MALEEAFVDIRANTAPFNQDLRSLNRQLERMESAVTVGADTRRAEREIDDFTDESRTTTVDVDADTTAAREAIENLTRDNRPVTVPVDADTSQARRQIDRLRDERGRFVSVNVDADEGGLGRITGLLDRLGGTLGRLARPLASLPVLFGVLGVAVGGLASALAPALGLIAAAPAVMLGAVAASGALQLAIAGVGDAFGAALTGDAAEFQKALEEIPAAARPAVMEVRALAPAFDELRESVSGAFFGQLEGEITATAAALSGPLRSGLTGIAAQWGAIASAALAAVRDQQTITSITSIMTSTEGVLARIGGRTEGIVRGFVRVGGAISDAFGGRAAQAIDDLLARVGDFLNRIAGSGQAVAWVEGALFVFQQLGMVLADLGGIFTAVFGAASDSGQGALGVIGMLLDAVREFAESDMGQETFSTLFQILGTLGQAASSLFGALSPILPVVAQLAGILADALGTAVAALLPGLTQFVTVLVAALRPVLVALTPILSTLGQIIGQVLSTALIALAPVLMIASDLLTAIFTAVQPLLPLLMQLVTTALTLFLSYTQQLLPVLTELVPVFTELLMAIVPILPPILQLAIQILSLITRLTPLIGLLARFEAAILSWVALNVIIPLIRLLVSALTTVITTLTRTTAAVTRFVRDAIAWFRTLYTDVTGWVTRMVTSVRGRLNDLVSSAGRIARSIVSAITAPFRNLWSGIRSAMSNINITGFLRNMVPSGLRRFLPFANGGIVFGPTPALIGEAGAEAVVPLTRPRRALQIARQSGLDRLIIADYNRRTHTLPAARTSPARELPAVQNFYVTSNASDTDLVARKTAQLVARAIGV